MVTVSGTPESPIPGHSKGHQNGSQEETTAGSRSRRDYSDEFKAEAVQMLLDGHTALAVVERLEISNVNMLYRWKQEQLVRSGPVATTLDS